MSKKHTNNIKETVVNQLIRAQARVTIEPVIKQGKPKIYCLDSHLKPSSTWEEKPTTYYEPMGECVKPRNKCTFVLSQLLRIEVPMEFDVDVDIEKGILRCGKPHIGSCESRYEEQSYENRYNELNLLDDEYEF